MTKKRRPDESDQVGSNPKTVQQILTLSDTTRKVITLRPYLPISD